MIRKLALLYFCILPSLLARGQESGSVFNFLKLPASSHAIALGGPNISLIEDDASLIFQNPALLSSVSNNSMNLNFMTYMKGTKMEVPLMPASPANGEHGGLESSLWAMVP